MIINLVARGNLLLPVPLKILAFFIPPENWFLARAVLVYEVILDLLRRALHVVLPAGAAPCASRARENRPACIVCQNFMLVQVAAGFAPIEPVSLNIVKSQRDWHAIVRPRKRRLSLVALMGTLEVRLQPLVGAVADD